MHNSEMPANAKIVIQGDGVAAQCCARLLTAAGSSVERRGAQRPRLPVIMIGASTQVLFQDAFETPKLFEGLHPIRHRVVAWGTGGTHDLPHSAVAVDEATLLARLQFDAPTPEPGEPDWTILAARQEGQKLPVQEFGKRVAFSLPVALSGTSDPFSGWVESVENGWLFLVSNAVGRAWLLGVGGTPEALLDSSKLVRAQVAETLGEAQQFPAHPRICWPPCGPGWLACGSGALAFDPLCGDGSGYAIREAILAAAVVKASAAGLDPEELAAHYRTRMLAGFQKHLQVCESFYQTGGSTPWWKAQAQSARDGVRWCEAELKLQPPFRFMLRGFDLIRLAYSRLLPSSAV